MYALTLVLCVECTLQLLIVVVQCNVLTVQRVCVCVCLAASSHPDQNKTCQAVQKHICAKNTYTILSRDRESKRKTPSGSTFYTSRPRSLHTMCYYNGRFSFFTHRHPYITRSLHSIHSPHYIWCSNDSLTVTVWSSFVPTYPWFQWILHYFIASWNFSRLCFFDCCAKIAS